MALLKPAAKPVAPQVPAEAQVFTTAGVVEQGAPWPDEGAPWPDENEHADSAYYQAPVQPPIPAPVTPQNTIAPSAPQGGSLVAPGTRSLGFAQKKVGPRSFPQIALKDDVFTDGDGRKYGSEIFGYILGSRDKIVYQGQPYKNPKTDVAFTYDDLTSNGRDLQVVLDEMKSRGLVISRREYQDVYFKIHAPGEPYHNQPRVLSIPPQSTERFGGFLTTLEFEVGGEGNVPGVLVRCYAGPKVERATFPFYPWGFERVQ